MFWYYDGWLGEVKITVGSNTYAQANHKDYHENNVTGGIFVGRFSSLFSIFVLDRSEFKTIE